MGRKALIHGFLAVFFVCAPIGPAVALAAQPVARVVLSYADTSQLPAVKVYASVLDGAGNPVDQLDKGSFALTEDSQKQDLVSVAPSTDNMRIVLALDTSGSMGEGAPGHQPIVEERKAAEAFVDYVKQVDAQNAGAADQLEVISFDEKAIIRQPMSADHNAAINAIRSLQAAPKWTALYDAAYQAVKDAAGAQPGRRAVVLFTDGKDEGPGGKLLSGVTLGDVVGLAQKNAVPLYTVGLGNQVDSAALGRMATLTGGDLSQTSDPTKLTGLFQHIANQLKNQYTIVYDSSGAATDHTIQVQANGAEASDSRAVHFPAVPPVVAIVEPKAGAQVRGDVQIVPGFSKFNQRQIARVEFRANGQIIGTSTTPPYSLLWKSGQIPPGPAELEVRAEDAGGQIGTSKTSVTVLPAPTVTPIPPSPTVVPTVTPQPVVIPTVVPVAISSSSSSLVLVVVLVAAAGVIGAVAFATSRRSPPALAVPGGLPLSPGGVPLDGGAKTVAIIASLTVLRGPTLVGETFNIGEHAVIGRDVMCDVAIDDPSKALSRRHAEIQHLDTGFMLSDLGSLNGTRVDGQAVTPGQSALVADNAEITLGGLYVLRFQRLATDVGPADRTRPIDPTISM